MHRRLPPREHLMAVCSFPLAGRGERANGKEYGIALAHPPPPPPNKPANALPCEVARMLNYSSATVPPAISRTIPSHQLDFGAATSPHSVKSHRCNLCVQAIGKTRPRPWRRTWRQLCFSSFRAGPPLSWDVADMLKLRARGPFSCLLNWQNPPPSDVIEDSEHSTRTVMPGQTLRRLRFHSRCIPPTDP